MKGCQRPLWPIAMCWLERVPTLGIHLPHHQVGVGVALENALQLLQLHLGERGMLGHLLPVPWPWMLDFLSPRSWFSTTIAADFVVFDLNGGRCLRCLCPH